MPGLNPASPIAILRGVELDAFFRAADLRVKARQFFAELNGRRIYRVDALPQSFCLGLFMTIKQSAYPAMKPPSMTSDVPVVNFAASDAK